MSKICQITGKKAMIELVYKEILLCRTRLLD